MTGTTSLPSSGVEAPTSSVAAVERCLDRIDERDSLIHAWAFLDPELALAQARARDGEDRRSMLHGSPVGVKDIIDTADQPTGYGSELWQGHRPDRDAEVVRRLRQAGAVILGKTTTTEFATYRPTATRNPHNTAHTPGGSSSGSAAAVADGQVPLALGTQTAGSVLRPGAFCGVFTLKPTYGRWPFDGVLPVALTFDTVGGFARHPAELAALDGVLADPGPERTLPAAADLRIGVLRPPWADRATPAAAAMLEHTVEALRAVVTDVVDVPVPEELAALDEAHTLIMAVEASAALADRIRRPGQVSDQLTRFLSDGRDAPAGTVQNARVVLRQARRFVDDAHRRVDVLLTLASTGEAPTGFASTGDPIFNKLASTAGVPGVGLPTGTGTDLLPLGIQLIAPAHSDQSLVHLATCLTDRFGIATRCPLPEELP
ncbi:amidase [Rhodococcus aetherivorans]|uniref:amidase n=1 Tax=Rhodococcus aetherivorans TaxID=191292 RepID=UPI000678E765|nr:amidase [Rhodococcus aetherivorans]UGQ39636.1 amidase [Rhodococcus aetherivorans]